MTIRSRPRSCALRTAAGVGMTSTASVREDGSHFTGADCFVYVFSDSGTTRGEISRWKHRLGAEGGFSHDVILADSSPRRCVVNLRRTYLLQSILRLLCIGRHLGFCVGRTLWCALPRSIGLLQRSGEDRCSGSSETCLAPPASEISRREQDFADPLTLSAASSIDSSVVRAGHLT